MITIDATSQGYKSSGSSLTYSHTCAGSDRALVVSIYSWQAVHIINSVTYGGVSMTALTSRGADGTGGKLSLYGLTAPTAGANDIVITTSVGGVQILSCSASYNGARQTNTFPDTETDGSSTATSFTATMTTTGSDYWVVAAGRTPSRNPTAGVNSFVRKLNSTSGDAAYLIDSNGGRPMGSNSLVWTISPSQTGYWVMTAIATGLPFTNPGNVYASDNAYATLPATSGDLTVQVSKDGGINYSSPLTVTFTGSDTTQTCGAGSTELWGMSFTRAEVVDSLFRIRLSQGQYSQIYKTFGFTTGADTLTGLEIAIEGKYASSTISIDHLKAKIYYGTSVLPIQAGSMAFASNGRKNGEGAGAGTGVLVYYDGTDWKATDTGATVAA